MAVQTRACNNNRQIKPAKQAQDDTASGNSNSSARRSYHRRRNRGKTIPKEFLESARYSVQSPNSTDSENPCAVAKKSRATLDNDPVQQQGPLTTISTSAAAQATAVKTTVSSDRGSAVPTTQEIKCKKSGKMFQYPGNFTNSTCTTSTLTPTTLRNIGDAFDYPAEVPPAPLEHNLAAGFAPPSVIVAQSFNNNQRLQDDVEIKREITEEDAGYVQTPWTDPVNQQNVDMNIYQTSLPYTTVASDVVRPQITATPSPRKRNQTNSPPQREATTKRRIKDEGVGTEEEERKRQRRERNKLAAARCRQRRVDQTQTLQIQVEGLEDRQKELQSEYEELEREKKRLRQSIDNHSCVQNDVSRASAVPVTTQSSVSMGQSTISGLPNVSCSQTIVSSPSQVNVIVRRDSIDSRLAEIVPTTLAAMPQQTERRPRPSTLPMSMFEQTGVPIQTPSAVLYSFEGLVEGTGLTPGVTPIGYSPTCTIQQRNSNGDVSTPDTTPRKLVTL